MQWQAKCRVYNQNLCINFTNNKEKLVGDKQWQNARK